MCPGHERWHPSPAFYYLPGGGPMLDMAPYYITALVNLLGPVGRVAGITTRARPERLITSEPLKGTRIPVEVATHAAGTLEFVSGAAITIAMSFDVARHRHRPLEVYGSDGAMSVPDPNFFGGDIELATASEDWRKVPTEHAYADGNYRIIGVADMAQAIRSGRPHRASGELAFHVLEVMEAVQRSSDEGRHIAIESRPDAAGHAADDSCQGRAGLMKSNRPLMAPRRLHHPGESQLRHPGESRDPPLRRSEFLGHRWSDSRRIGSRLSPG